MGVTSTWLLTLGVLITGPPWLSNGGVPLYGAAVAACTWWQPVLTGWTMPPNPPERLGVLLAEHEAAALRAPAADAVPARETSPLSVSARVAASASSAFLRRLPD
ncbi:MAG: hypothetical protein ACR2LF_12210 [Jatrophihabitantaceae bacterium]